jgi:dihydrofolate reductase
MRKLMVYTLLSADGYFVDADGKMDWAKDRPDPDYQAFAEQNASGDAVLLYGRITYEMMASFWPTPAAQQMMPAMAERMNRLPKIVFSRTLHQAHWNNTTVCGDDAVEAVREMKQQDGPGMCILGSGSLTSQLARAGLIDEYQFMINPVAVGSGRTLFEGMTKRLELELTQTRSFNNGKVFVCYKPVA